MCCYNLKFTRNFDPNSNRTNLQRKYRQYYLLTEQRGKKDCRDRFVKCISVYTCECSLVLSSSSHYLNQYTYMVLMSESMWTRAHHEVGTNWCHERVEKDIKSAQQVQLTEHTFMFLPLVLSARCTTGQQDNTELTNSCKCNTHGFLAALASSPSAASCGGSSSRRQWCSATLVLWNSRVIGGVCHRPDSQHQLQHTHLRGRSSALLDVRKTHTHTDETSCTKK